MARKLTCDICDEEGQLSPAGLPRGWKTAALKIEKATLKSFDVCTACVKSFQDRSDELLVGFPAEVEEDAGATEEAEAGETEEAEAEADPDEETDEAEEGQDDADDEPIAAAPKWERRPGEHQRKDWHLQLDKACELKVGYEPNRQWVARVIVNGKTTDQRANFENRGEAMGWVTKQANFGG